MANLGAPQTNKFAIGTAEVRLGSLVNANKLTQSSSIGLVDSANLEVTQNSVDLLGGFPQTIIDTAIVSQESSLTATLREYSKRNIDVLLGNGVAGFIADLETDITGAALIVGETTIPVADETGFSAGDVVVLFDEAFPENLTISVVASTAALSIELDPNLPLLVGLDPTGATTRIFKGNQSAIGAGGGCAAGSQNFSVQLTQLQKANCRPVSFVFWKGTIGAGMTYNTDATDFASTELNIKLLQPAASEYATGADLEHVAALIPSHPVGMFVSGGDL